MTHFEIAALYLGLNLILAVTLILRVGQLRLSEKIFLGDGAHEGLYARIRAQANYVENAPFLLIGLFALAALKANPIILHGLGASFVIGRILHAHGMAQEKSSGKGRMIGIMLTLLCYLVTAATLFASIIFG